MQVQYLIIGQGIAGTLLSYAFWKQGRSFLVIDEPPPTPAASVVAGAVINPVNVNRWTMVAGQQQYIPAALETYRSMEETLGFSLIEALPLLVFHKDETMQQLFSAQQLVYPQYIQHPAPGEIKLARQFFSSGYIGKVEPVWKVHATKLLSGWSDFLKHKGWLIRERFDLSACTISPQMICYQDIQSESVIFCEGAAAAYNPLFKHLPFTKNRGDALLLSIPGLPAQYIYHSGTRLVPVANELFWCGGNYRWQFADLLPDQDWRMQTESALRQWLRLPFKVADHLVAERPTTAGQQFFTGIHPALSSVAIFNGLGTKGFFCGPALAIDLSRELAQPGSLPGKGTISLQRWLK